MEREVANAIEKVNRKVSHLERNAEAARPMRLSFPTKVALDAFAGWPGLVGYVEADNRDYVWAPYWGTAGWNAWDTGWVDVGVASGKAAIQTAERPQVRRIGESVFMRGGWSNTGIAVGSVTVVGTVPAGFRPEVNVITHIGTSSGAAAASGYVTSTGEVQVRTNATASAYYMFGGMAWPLG